jgi:hypothetical protein
MDHINTRKGGQNAFIRGTCARFRSVFAYPGTVAGFGRPTGRAIA